MENKNIIIILVVIIIILVAIVGMMLLQPSNTKSTVVKIISDPKLNEGDELAIQLTCLDGTPIPKEKVDVIITNNKGKVVVNETVKTNSKGKAKLDLDLKKGKYDVNVTFKGDENYNGDVATQILRIKETATEMVSDTKSVDTGNYPKYSQVFGYYRTIETQNELALIETSNGNYYVLGGDGYYTYGGHDSQGYIQLGSYVGKY